MARVCPQSSQVHSAAMLHLLELGTVSCDHVLCHWGCGRDALAGMDLLSLGCYKRVSPTSVSSRMLLPWCHPPVMTLPRRQGDPYQSHCYASQSPQLLSLYTFPGVFCNSRQMWSLQWHLFGFVSVLKHLIIKTPELRTAYGQPIWSQRFQGRSEGLYLKEQHRAGGALGPGPATYWLHRLEWPLNQIWMFHFV